MAAQAASPAAEDSKNDFKECRWMQSGFGVVPGRSWGVADQDTKDRWTRLECDRLIMGEEAAKPEGRGGQELPIDCRER